MGDHYIWKSGLADKNWREHIGIRVASPSASPDSRDNQNTNTDLRFILT